jgi:hypothetical protein
MINNKNRAITLTCQKCLKCLNCNSELSRQLCVGLLSLFFLFWAARSAPVTFTQDPRCPRRGNTNFFFWAKHFK